MTVKPDKDQAYLAWKKWDLGQFAAYRSDDAGYFSRELARSGIPGIQGKRVLEIGFGSGTFAGWARDQGAEYVGTEVNLDLVNAGRDCGFEVVSADRLGEAGFNPGTIDLAVAFDVFEHLEYDELYSLLGVIRSALKTDGIIVARVPSGDSPFSRAIQNGDVTHKICLGSSVLPYLAAHTGFRLVAVREPVFPLTGHGFWAFLRRSCVQVVRRLAYPIISACFMGGGNLVLSPNMVFVLAKV